MSYRGECLEVADYELSFRKATETANFACEALKLEGSPPILIATRQEMGAKLSIYIDGSPHGDEPAGATAILDLLKQGQLPRGVNYCLIPYLNPYGLVYNQRNNAEDIDINRDYYRFATAEAIAHRQWLEQADWRFDAAIRLHEDWDAEGFYLYTQQHAGQPEVADTVLAAVRRDYPIDERSSIDGNPARGGHILIPEELDFGEDWPCGPYLFKHYAQISCTFETASNQHPLRTRAAAHVQGILAVIKALLS